jgi:hypothetical protein
MIFYCIGHVPNPGLSTTLSDTRPKAFGRILVVTTLGRMPAVQSIEITGLIHFDSLSL